MKKMFALVLALMMMASFALAEEGFTLEDTAWTFAGGLIDGVELDEAAATELLNTTYQGVLQLAFAADGTAALVHGVGQMIGTWAVAEDGGVGMLLDNNGEQLAYALNLVDMEGQIVMMMTPDNVNFFYFILIEAE